MNHVKRVSTKAKVFISVRKECEVKAKRFNNRRHLAHLWLRAQFDACIGHVPRDVMM